ncbi:MAG: hypothetical protein AB8B72_13315 [Crocinitomicaceae bacterium]
MKRTFLLPLLALSIVSCSNFTDEQAAAAQFVCECIDKDENEIGDPGILYHICFEEQAKEKFDKSIFADEGYANALFETCPEKNLVSEQ